MSHPRKRLVMGNWKMHGSLQDNAALLGALLSGAVRGGDTELAVCVPFPYLSQTQALLSGSPVSWGAQDVSIHERGAYTGETSAAMLADFGCSWVLCGHSERRAMHAESSSLVAAKASSALACGLSPVVCVGETLPERDAGNAERVIGDQLDPVLALGAGALGRMVIAYEPVWAIGTGRTATPDQAQAVHAFIRAALSRRGAGQTRILYGGSVKAANAAALFAQPDIDGALVGGASLVADEFLKIAAA
ncbi:MAG: triose-phosphate isomerase [Castellaniella sp.]|uniref:triose-phosphate isomerase n=1 Tax=Castellaniella sp. TaxID=1955812 RepID=UPI00121D9D4A|nr:triose-phosphate isomerase [Castellaniella sp.]TAN26015.1 MAG: triose-phosphate isomerase [Castellaniella sp.]